MIKSSLKRERRVRRQTHRRKFTKEQATKYLGEISGLRKHLPTRSNIRTKVNGSTFTPGKLIAPLLGKLFKEATRPVKRKITFK